MAIVDFLPFATAVDANVADQATYAAAPTTGTGYLDGPADATLCNKAWRQGAFMASVLANWISETLSDDVLDDGDLSGHVTQLNNAVVGSVTTPANMSAALSPNNATITMEPTGTGTLVIAPVTTEGSISNMAITVKAGTHFKIVDPSDPTKIAEFACSGISTGTTRNFTLPDTSGTLAIGGGIGGSSGQLQYNNAGVWGGVTGVTSDGASLTFADGDLKLSGSSSGTATLKAPASGGGTVILPAGSVTLASLSANTFSGTQTFADGGLWGASGAVLGTATGGAQGAGTLNLAGDIYINGSALIDVQEFSTTAGGTWTKPPGAKVVHVILIGPGGGGGGGGAGATGTNRTGGGGGGGGSCIIMWFKASTLGATETVTIGAGGTGGISNGNGNNGGTSQFGNWIAAYGGNGGTRNSGGGAGGGLFSVGGGTGGGTLGSNGTDSASTNVGAGGAGAANAAANSNTGGHGAIAGNGGSSGGCVQDSGNIGAGTNGVNPFSLTTGPTGGAAGGSTGGNGGDATIMFGSGAGGGAAYGANPVGGNGGKGNRGGGGGGGGGAMFSSGSATGGTGGAGGDGYCIVRTYS